MKKIIILLMFIAFIISPFLELVNAYAQDDYSCCKSQCQCNVAKCS